MTELVSLNSMCDACDYYDMNLDESPRLCPNFFYFKASMRLADDDLLLKQLGYCDKYTPKVEF